MPIGITGFLLLTGIGAISCKPESDSSVKVVADGIKPISIEELKGHPHRRVASELRLPTGCVACVSFGAFLNDDLSFNEVDLRDPMDIDFVEISIEKRTGNQSDVMFMQIYRSEDIPAALLRSPKDMVKIANGQVIFDLGATVVAVEM